MIRGSIVASISACHAEDPGFNSRLRRFGVQYLVRFGVFIVWSCCFWWVRIASGYEPA